MATFTRVEMPTARTYLWEASAEAQCPCGRHVILGNSMAHATEDDVPCPCGRVYRLRLVIEVADGA